jgi:pimeloyl-ACP methyl ester carboxylesterase
MKSYRVTAAFAAGLAIVVGMLGASHAKDGAAIEVVPLVLVHGHGADPSAWSAFLDRYGVGRVRVASLYAAEADQLKPGDLPKACVVAAGYYMDSACEEKFGDKDGSIGGCPVARTDEFASRYKVSFARRLARIVDGVCRASGSDRVDLALHSMGNLVGRAYTRWLSSEGGKCKVRRLLCIVGPHRGINALEATVDGLDHHGERDFMDMGELAEMCHEYKVWGGESFTDQLNYGWDSFCSSNAVQYAGISASGALGKQVDPSDPNDSSAPKILGFKVTGAYGSIVKAIEGANRSNLPLVDPFVDVWSSWSYHRVWGVLGYPVPNLIAEIQEAFGPGDGTVRLASSRMDQDPFYQAQTWALFEGRHGDTWNPEQSANNSTFATELARELCFVGNVGKGGSVDRWQLKKWDAPGKASFLALETSISGAPLVAAQIVERRVGGDGKIDGNAATVSYGCPLPLGAQRAFIPIAAGGGRRSYHLVLYGPAGAVVETTDDVVLDLQDGVAEEAPTTSLGDPPAAGAGAESVGLVAALSELGATPAATPVSTAQAEASVHVQATSNTASSDATLRFSFRLDDGNWTPFTTKAVYDSPVLAAGEHRLEARARHANNAAQVACDDAQGTAIGILVDGQGKVSIRH